MRKVQISQTGSPILVFNPLKRLVGCFHSVCAMATVFKVSRASIHQACVGKIISTCGVYVRFLADDIEIEDEDYGKLKLQEYDEMCGVSRKYWPTSSMSRKGTKYKKTNKTNKTNII